ncbi:Atlastin-1 (GTP-binding protein 3), partial [Fasciolopsis buskii]
VCGPEKPYVNPHDLEAAHTRAFNAALEKFNGIRKMGGESFAAIYLERLKSQLQQLANEYRVANTNKNIFQNFRTPAVFAVMLFIFYVITGISEFIGLSSVTNMLLVPFYMALVTLFTWLFLNYTGRAPEVAQAIDNTADIVVQKVSL